MSRVGRKVIVVPAGVKVSVSEAALEVQGPKGKLTTPVPPGIKFALQGQELSCQRASDERQLRAFHGLARALAQNADQGRDRGLHRGPRHRGRGLPRRGRGQQGGVRPRLLAPGGVPDPGGDQDRGREADARDRVSGIDRQKVGQVAAEIRRLRRPDPYKQKGIRYVGEVLKKKAGKAGATGAK